LWVVRSGTARSLVLRCTYDVRSGSKPAADLHDRRRQVLQKPDMTILRSLIFHKVATLLNPNGLR
jgi:hypothetical protein